MTKSKENSEHYLWGNNCDSWVLLNSENLSIKQEKMPKGTKEKLHFHEKAQQFFYILSGKATFYVKDERFEVNAKEGISILPTVNHFISNESLEDLEFLVISNPSTNSDRILV
jgi:mannose-6-phosphate isomerase-like protein (cupin superfamily)